MENPATDSKSSRSLQNYILRQLAIAFLIVQGSIVGVIWIIGSLRHLRWVINNGMPFLDYLYFNLLTIPVNFKAVVMPAAVISIVFVYNRLISDREWVAMSAAGLSTARLAAPALIAAALIAAFLALHVSLLLPLAYREFRAIAHDANNAGLVLNLKEREFTSVANTLTIYVGKRHSSSDFEDILVWDTTNPVAPIALVAEQAQLIFEHGRPFFVLNDGEQQSYDRETRGTSHTGFEQYTFNLRQYIAERTGPGVDAREFFIHELWARAQAEPPRPKFRRQAFGRITSVFKLLAVVTIALAIMLSGPLNRKGQAWRIAAAIGVMFIVEAVVTVLVNAAVQSPAAIFSVFMLCGLLIAGGLWSLFRSRLTEPMRIPARLRRLLPI